MRYKKGWAIPNYQGYYISIKPFRIISAMRGKNKILKWMGRQSTGHPYVRLHKPGHKRVSCSIVKLACLTFHGQQPKGFVGYYVGNGQYDDIAPNTVWWMPEHEALNRNRRKLTDEQRWEVLDMYFEDEIPITKIAPLFNVSTSTIWEIIKKSKDRIKYVQY